MVYNKQICLVGYEKQQRNKLANSRTKLVRLRRIVQMGLHLWLCCWKKLPTRCMFCNLEDESHGHLFFDYAHTANVWSSIQRTILF